MNTEQLQALIQLEQALTACTDTGVFDEIAGERLHPDQINCFCDGIIETVKDQKPSPEAAYLTPRHGE